VGAWKDALDRGPRPFILNRAVHEGASYRAWLLSFPWDFGSVLALRRYRQSVTVTTESWLEQYARSLGIDPPTPEELNDLLGLAGVAAHASERTAAPVSCWLAARAGVPPSQARSLASELAKSID
jgi:hypothetical protein